MAKPTLRPTVHANLAITSVPLTPAFEAAQRAACELRSNGGSEADVFELYARYSRAEGALESADHLSQWAHAKREGNAGFRGCVGRLFDGGPSWNALPVYPETVS